MPERDLDLPAMRQVLFARQDEWQIDAVDHNVATQQTIGGHNLVELILDTRHSRNVC